MASTTFGLAMLALSITPNLAWTYPIGMVVGFASISFLTASTAIVQVQAAPEMRGRVLALQAIVFLGSTPIGGPIVGFVSQEWGPCAGIALGACACLFAAAFGTVAARRVHLGATLGRVDDDAKNSTLQVA